jgi:hypothetical protein
MNESHADWKASERALPDVVGTVYDQAPVRLRTKLLALLLGALGPLAMAALSQGGFARFLLRDPSEETFVTTQDVLSIPTGHIMALVRYVTEACPERLSGLVALLQREDPALFGTVAGAVLVLLVDAWMRRNSRHGASRPDS